LRIFKGDRDNDAVGRGAKDGSGMAAILEDPSVVISVALQYGISARALAKSTARLRQHRLHRPIWTTRLAPFPRHPSSARRSI
jgi:hypothetical protein